MIFGKAFKEFGDNLVFYIVYLLYETKYYFLGTLAILEDIVFRHRNKCELISCRGDIAVVTGGSRGMGVDLVKKLLQCEMHVIIGCRDIKAGEKAVARIREEGITSGYTSVYALDLTSLASVIEFSRTINETCAHLNLLVNNAGIMFVPYKETADGVESHWEVNYLAPFLLTHLLIPVLKKSTSSRVVNVTSCAHYASNPLDFNDINMKKGYIPSAAYARSKLAQILFTQQLDGLFRLENPTIKFIAVHPGIVNTELFNGTLLKTFFPWVLKYICKSADEGATTLLYASISPELKDKGGVYISNCQEITPSSLARNKVIQAMLFEHTCKFLKISNFGVA